MPNQREIGAWGAAHALSRRLGKYKIWITGLESFELTEKAVVKGDGAHPFYKWAAATLGPKSEPGWNFHKYLVGRDGRVVASFFSGVAPDAKELISAVEAELAKPVATATQ